MATLASVQRSAALLSARGPARRVLSTALRASAPRGLASLTNPRTSTNTRTQVPKPSYQFQTQIQKRHNSNDTSLRNWGFEEINASLPSSPNSPSHTPILVDVREPAELASGIIPSAISIPFASQADAIFLTPDEFETRFGFPKPDDGAQIVFYCKAGVRAKAAAQLAVQAGYDPAKVGYYWGSWLDWERNGGKVERWDGDE